MTVYITVGGKPNDVVNSPGTYSPSVDNLTNEISHLSGLDVTDIRNAIWGTPDNSQSTAPGAPGDETIPGPTSINGSLDDLVKWLQEQATTLIFALVVLLLIIFGIGGILKGKS